MRVKLKLFASLRQYLPEAQGGELDVGVADGTTAGDLLARHGLPREQVHLVLVNGQYVAPGEMGQHVLQEGDEVALWPPVAGG